MNNTENVARRCKKAWNITYIVSFSSSSDFNVIENIWRIIKLRIKVYERSIIIIKDIKAAMQTKQDKIIIENIEKFIKIMFKRMQQAHKCNEYKTKFWIALNHIFKILKTLKLHVWCSLTMRIEIWVKMSKIFKIYLV